MDKIKFQTNIPVRVTFKYNQPKESTHEEFGTSYGYGVDSDAGGIFYATELLHKTLQACNVKQGVTVDIVKGEDPTDGRKKVWLVLDMNGKPLGRSDDLPFGNTADAQGTPTSPDHSQPTQQQGPQQEEPPPMDDMPPPIEYGQPYQTSGQAMAQQGNHQRIKEELACTMDQAYKMAALVAKLHNVHPEHTAACAHSFFIELRKKGYRPEEKDIADTLKRMREVAQNA